MTTDDRNIFAEEVRAAVLAAGATEASYDGADFMIRYRSADDKEGLLYLDNLYQECRGESEVDRGSRIAWFVEQVLHPAEIPQDWERAAPTLRPVLRPATFGLGAGTIIEKAVSRAALPYLREFVVSDTPTTMAYVTTSEVDGWGVDIETVYATARANLATLPDLRPVNAPASSEFQIYRFVEDGDSYFTSRLLLDGWLAAMASRPGGRPVAFVPDTNTLMVLTDEPDSLVPMMEMFEKHYAEAARPLSPQAYTVDDLGRTIPYPVVDGHSTATAASRAAAVLAAAEYAAQKEWLTDKYEFDLIDIFVASVLTRQREDGSIQSFASWGQDVDTALPRADVIIFGPADGPPIFVPWNDAAELVDLPLMTDLDPPRYHVDYWPDPQIIERLHACAITPG
jgi:hypothetical protein